MEMLELGEFIEEIIIVRNKRLSCYSQKG